MEARARLLPHLQKKSLKSTGTFGMRHHMEVDHFRPTSRHINFLITVCINDSFLFTSYLFVVAKYLAAFEELSISNQTEGSGAASGVFWVEASLDTRSMTRSTSKSAYYDGIANRPNLHLLTGQKVNKIVLSNLTASGIEFSSADGNSSSTAYASREVILAAGAVHTPQILQLSGIGPREVLENASVETILDLPGVGSGFQDHPVVYLLTNRKSLS